MNVALVEKDLLDTFTQYVYLFLYLSSKFEADYLILQSRSYGFDVESYVIPAFQGDQHAFTALQKKIYDFQQTSRKDSLQILIYSGHATINTKSIYVIA